MTNKDLKKEILEETKSKVSDEIRSDIHLLGMHTWAITDLAISIAIQRTREECEMNPKIDLEGAYEEGYQVGYKKGETNERFSEGSSYNKGRKDEARTHHWKVKQERQKAIKEVLEKVERLQKASERSKYFKSASVVLEQLKKEIEK